MKLKKILALGLAAAMTASLAACGGASSGGNSGSVAPALSACFQGVWLPHVGRCGPFEKKV